MENCERVTSTSNRLINEQSPYLLQHANNPVNWYPWGDEAFRQAAKEDKPVFLSIGYSTCHWCHVMARESFTDEEVAEHLNRVFICIKVDREERPDIDKIYMKVCQLLTGSGGWPLTIIMTPEKKPFYAGTYLPKKSKYGRTGLIELTEKIEELWNNNRKQLLGSARQITEKIKTINENAPDQLNKNILDQGYQELKNRFDINFGGFDKSPKFPMPHQMIFLLHYWQRTKNIFALQMVEKTLMAMRSGGIYDHLGYGFHRYSTDRRWILPHFEKMLYDQALLLNTYTEAYQATGRIIYKKTAKEIVTYVKGRLLSPDGGFYSAEDAESEGEEGKFYLWEKEEIKDILDDDLADYFLNVYNVRNEGNYHQETDGKKTGKNVLYRNEINGDDYKLAEARRILYEARKERVHPQIDDKILTDWNGLMIAGLAKAARVFSENKYLVMAQNAFDFIEKNMYDKKRGILYHRYRKGDTSIEGNIDDYSFLIWGLIELYETSFDVYYLDKAFNLNDYLLEHFWDEKEGGFYFTADNTEKILTRQKEIYDGAVPSGNSVAFGNLLKLSHLTGDIELENRVNKMSQCFARHIKRAPSSHMQMLIGLQGHLNTFYDIIITGSSKDDKKSRFLENLNKIYLPNKIVIFKDVDNPLEITRIAQYMENYGMINNQPSAYVCKNGECKLPTNNVKEFISLLHE